MKLLNKSSKNCHYLFWMTVSIIIIPAAFLSTGVTEIVGVVVCPSTFGTFQAEMIQSIALVAPAFFGIDLSLDGKPIFFSQTWHAPSITTNVVDPILSHESQSDLQLIKRFTRRSMHDPQWCVFSCPGCPSWSKAVLAESLPDRQVRLADIELGIFAFEDVESRESGFCACCHSIFLSPVG